MSALVTAAMGAVTLTACAPTHDAASDATSSTPQATTTMAPSAMPSSPITPTKSAQPKNNTIAQRRHSMDIPDKVILRQLRNAAERRAQYLATASPTPEPAEVPPGGNRQLGYNLMLEFGYPADQWAYLEALWTRESGWNHLAENSSSGAYGIPQSLPGNKMASVGGDWRSNPETQIRWGLAYISARYGTPKAAKAHSDRLNWY